MFRPIKLYTVATPNGLKVSNFLEELKAVYNKKNGFDYEAQSIAFSKNEQKSEWFLKINPNGRIPAITDFNKKGLDGQEGFNVWETASIILYLQEHYDPDNVFSFGPNEKDADLYRAEILNWVFFIHGGVGPMQGQFNHFNRYAPEKIEYGITRYKNETARLYSVLEDRLKDRDWLVGPGRGKYSIADINAYPWIHIGRHSGLDDDQIGPNLQAWIERNWQRDAVQRGVRVPTYNELMPDMIKPGYSERHKKTIEETSQKNAQWIQAGNKM